MNEVISLYKPAGLTPSQLIDDLKKKYPSFEGVKISPAGRLDPMAEGLVLLLVGDANKRRDEFLKLDKTYEFSILFGITTDTYDLLGKVLKTDFSYSYPVLSEKLPKLLASHIGKTSQPYPPFSSKPVNGKPLFHYARTKQLEEIILPEKTVTIKELHLISLYKDTTDEVKKTTLEKISAVAGDFRQEEITKIWEEQFPSFPTTLSVAECTATVSSGTYIRSLAHTLGEELGCGALAFSIKRTKIGNYRVEDALYLNEQ